MAPRSAALFLSHRQELEEITVRIFKEHTFMNARSTSFAEGLAGAITGTVHHALALQLRAFNESNSLQPRLPPELWAMVWTELNVHDRLVVTHVSHNWRQLASRCPQLWTELSAASNQHQFDCDCEVCHPPYEDAVRLSTRRGQCRWCLRHPHPRLGTNTPLIEHLIGRSGRLPISLRVDMSGSKRMDAAAIQDLSAVVAPHVHRVRTLDAHTDNPKVFIHNFLVPLATLSGLVQLQLRIDCRGDYTSPLVQQLQFPRLKVLDITGRGFHLSNLNFFAPSVHTLSCVLRTPSDIAHVLRACPTAQDVTMIVSHMRATVLTPALFDEPDQAVIAHFLSAANPARISFVGVGFHTCTGIVTAFRSTAAVVDIDFSGSEPPEDLISFIANVDGATELELLVMSDNTSPKVSFALLEGAGRCRRVHFDYYEEEDENATLASTIWAAVREPLTLRKIAVHSVMVAALFQNAPDLRIKELVVEFGRLDRAGSLVDWLDPDEEATINTQPFANLKNLIIRASRHEAWEVPIPGDKILHGISRQLGRQRPERRDSVIIITTKGLMVDIGGETGAPFWEELAKNAIEL